MEKNIYDNYLAILREEMVPAMGCTEPIALAYGAARAREVLGREPEHIVAKCSGNIIKNVRCVIIPNSGGLKGIPAGVVLGAVAGDASLDMEVLSKVTDEGRKRCRELLDADICKVELLDTPVVLHIVIEMSAGEDEEQEAAEEIEEELGTFEEVFEKLRISTLLIGPYDADNAIVTLHAGAGGTEAMDWTSMLYRMYSRWAEKRGYEVEVLDYLEGDVAGIKGVTFEVKGENAYGYLRSEKGVHRLVRISPFNANGKRQTSFASCDVIPDIEEDIDIEINDDDIRVDTYRSSGAGGQHINKTSSAIRITHLPTGIVVQCQNERSQHMNKDKAMQMLKSKLYVLKQQEQAEKMSDIRGEVRDINFGNQIRSYVMQPYTLVKDHRTNAEISNVGAVMDGNIDPFINAYLSMDAEAQKGKKAE